MSYAIVTTKVDPQTKNSAQEIAKELGIPLSVVIKGFLKQFIRTRSLNLSLQNEEPSEYLKKILSQAEKDYKKGNTSPSFKKPEDFISYLHKNAKES